MRRLLIFVTLIAWACAASVSDGGFARFCTQDLEGKLKKDAKNPNYMTCTATFTLDGVTEASAASICRHRGRFAVKEAKANGDELTCTWETTGKCDGGHYIYGFCYKVARKCSADWPVAAANDRQAFRWIAYTFSSQRVAKFRTSSKVKKPTKMYSRGTLLPASGKNTEMAVLLSSMPVFRGHPGDVVYVDKKDNTVWSVCRKRSVGGPQIDRITAPDGKPDPNNHGSGGSSHVIEAGEFTLLPTRNLYQPKLVDGQVDLRYFHQVCENICDGCYAATMDFLAKLPKNLFEQRYWLPGGRNDIAAESVCQVKTKDSALNKWKVHYHNRHPDPGVLNASYWKTGLPNRECSDQGRYAMAYEQGKVIDVPIFDRLPLVCVRGPAPPVPKEVTNCLKNSENDAVTGGCKCKAGFKDVLDPKSMEEQDQKIKDYVRDNVKGQLKGFVCVMDTCNVAVREIEPEFDAILLVIDGSGSIELHNWLLGFVCVLDTCNMAVRERELEFDAILMVIDGSESIGRADWKNVQKFVYAAVTWLPKKAAIFLMQYSIRQITDKINADWTEEEYMAAAQRVVGTYIARTTPTYEAIRDMTTYWLDSNPAKPRAIMFVITDGIPNGKIKERNARAAIIQRARDSGIDMKYVAVRNFETQFMREDVLDPAKDIIKMNSYAELAAELQGKLEEYMKCAPMTVEEIAEAMSVPYE